MASYLTSHRRLFSVVIYGSAYLFLYLILLGLLIITPADAIDRSLRSRQLHNIWILTAGYLTTIVVVAFVFFTRLYINKNELAAIPKGWVPIEKGDVPSRVYKMIAAGLSRSANIAYEARPRLRTGDEEQEEADRSRLVLLMDNSKTDAEETAVMVPSREAIWGDIEHYGWASPNSPDLPNLQYMTVFSELPNLIEGKALTLAPPDPTSEADPPMLDPEAVALLQRTANMDLRDYMMHLAELEVLDMDATTMQFLSQYEYARFSTRPISNARFKELMHLFAEILRAMEPFDPELPDEEEQEEEGDEASDMTSTESQADYEARMEPIMATPRSKYSRAGSTASISSSARQAKRKSSTSFYQWRTAPNSLRSRRTGLTRKSSHSLAQSRQLQTVSSQPSTSSLRSRASASSGSVIRLATRHDASDLPYILSLRGTSGTF